MPCGADGMTCDALIDVAQVLERTATRSNRICLTVNPPTSPKDITLSHGTSTWLGALLEPSASQQAP